MDQGFSDNKVGTRMCVMNRRLWGYGCNRDVVRKVVRGVVEGSYWRQG